MIGIARSAFAFALVSSLGAAGSVSAQGAAGDLYLVCRGVSTGTVEETGSVRNSDGDRASVSVNRVVRSERTYQLDLGAQSGRIRVPVTALPVLSTKKTDGWFDLTSLSMDDDKITGKFTLNVLNKPSFRIDRRTGDMEMRGYGFTFAGACERGSNAPESRKF